jgi:hypothetical protein
MEMQNKSMSLKTDIQQCGDFEDRDVAKKKSSQSQHTSHLAPPIVQIGVIHDMQEHET